MDRRVFLKGLGLTLGTGLIGAEIISEPKEINEVALDSTEILSTGPLTAEECLCSIDMNFDGDVLNSYVVSDKYLTPKLFPHAYDDMVLLKSCGAVEKRKRMLSYKNPLLAPFIK